MKHLKLFEDFSTLKIEHPVNNKENVVVENNKSLIKLRDDALKLRNTIYEQFPNANLVNKFSDDIFENPKKMEFYNLAIKFRETSIVNIKKATELIEFFGDEHKNGVKIENKNIKDTYLKDRQMFQNVFLRQLRADMSNLIENVNDFIRHYDKAYRYNVELDESQVQDLKVLYKTVKNYDKTGELDTEEIARRTKSVRWISKIMMDDYRRLHKVKYTEFMLIRDIKI